MVNQQRRDYYTDDDIAGASIIDLYKDVFAPGPNGTAAIRTMPESEYVGAPVASEAALSTIPSPFIGELRFILDINIYATYNGTEWVTTAAGDVTSLISGNGITVSSATGDVTVSTSIGVNGGLGYSSGSIIVNTDNATIEKDGSGNLKIVDGLIPTVSDIAYDAISWDGNADAPSKNAVRDKIESMISDTAYDSVSWNGSIIAPTKNAVRDKIESMVADIATNAAAIPTISDVAYSETTWDGNTDGATKNSIRDQIESIKTTIATKKDDFVENTAFNKNFETTTSPGALGSASLGAANTLSRSDHVHPLPKLDDLNAPDNNTDLNVSISAHGLCPILPNNSTTFLNGVGGYTTPIVDVSDYTATTGIPSGADQVLLDKSGTLYRITLDNLSKRNKTIVLTAGGGMPATTSPCSDPTQISIGSYDHIVCDFDPATNEILEWDIVMADDYNGGTVSVQIFWTTNSTNTGQCNWIFYGGCYGNGDLLSGAVGSGVALSDSGNGTANDLLLTSTVNLTIANAAAGELCKLRLLRNASAAGDTLTSDARFLCAKIEYTTNSWSA